MTTGKSVTVLTDSFPNLAPRGSVLPVQRFSTGNTPPVPMVVVEANGYPLCLYMDEVTMEDS